MKIAHPPSGLGLSEANLLKQEQVATLVYLPREDHMLKGKLSQADLHRAHEADHVSLVLQGEHANGFCNVDPRYVDHARESCAAMLTAARAAVHGGLDGVHVAFAPASGFHHAGWAYSGGYCTFNGLMVAALKLREEGLLPNGLLIIDGDGHYGDGTEDIIQQLDLDWVEHVALDKVSVSGSAAKSRSVMFAALCRREYSLVMYQAGADAHVADPYGAGYLTDEEWGERDMLVFSTCKARGLPVAWNLAGGYNGAKTLTLHCRTFMAALQVFYPGSTRVLHKRMFESGHPVLTRPLCGPNGPSDTAGKPGL